MLANVVSSHAPDTQGLTKDLLNGILAASHSSSGAQQMTDAELCNRTTTLAQQMRTFESESAAADRDKELKEFQEAVGKTQEERTAIWNRQSQERYQRMLTHDAQFENRFMSDAKYDQDRIFDRIPVKTRDEIVGHNGEAESVLRQSKFVGAGNGFMLASYLDELAKALCVK
jgi:hypothetical protein